MRRVLTLSIGFALVCAFLPAEALAKSRKAAPAQQPAAESDDFPVSLPKNLTTNKDWLDDGTGDPASGTLQPNAKANDNYFKQQQNFSQQDPLRWTQSGSILDNR